MKLRSICFLGLAIILSAAVYLALNLPSGPQAVMDESAIRTQKTMWSVIGVVSLVLLFVLRRLFADADRKTGYLQREHDYMQNVMASNARQSTVLNRINDLIEVFGETRDLDAVLNEAMNALDEVLGTDVLVLQLDSTEDSRFFKRIERGGTDVNLGDEIHKDVIDKRKSRLINELANYREYPMLSEKGYHSLIVAPLVRNLPGGKRESIGLIAALSIERRDFTGEDLSLLSSFAQQAGLIIENAHLYEKTRHMAMHDGLTNLANFRRFKQLLDSEVERCRKTDGELVLIMGDIDHFKNYNDTWGHQEGDKVLRGVADIMLDNTRGADIVARYGGEEFVLVLPDTKVGGARAVGESILGRIADHEFPGENTQPGGDLTITFGLAHFPSDADSPQALIEVADKALYYGKHRGKNCLIVASEHREEIEKEAARKTTSGASSQ